MKNKSSGQVDWLITLVPMVLIVALCVLFAVIPEQSALLLTTVRTFLGDDCGILIALLGIGSLGCTMYMAFSRFGKIRFGNLEKPAYSELRWGAMIFTSTMAADILFYSLCEWALYASEPQIERMGSVQMWASTYPLFHWGPVVWSFYIMISVTVGFMLHVRGKDKQKFSEACRPLLGKHADGLPGRIIDLMATMIIIMACASGFSIATPLLSASLSRVFGFPNTVVLTIIVMLAIAVAYAIPVLIGMKGISRLASMCTWVFTALLVYVFVFGGEQRYILETGLSAIGNLVQNFPGMVTWMDPLRETSFPQNWTLYYWCYWMTGAVATPFFIGGISKGRTVKSTVLGCYGWGLAGTFTSFIILGNYGLAQQVKHGLNISDYIAQTGDYSGAILKIVDTLPLSNLAIILIVIAMMMFSSTTMDSIAWVTASFSCKRLTVGEEPPNGLKAFWAIMFILVPIALVFAKNSMYNLQTLAMIGAMLAGVVMVLTVISFFKDANKFLKEKPETEKTGE